jgi:hypothetical protein
MKRRLLVLILVSLFLTQLIAPSSAVAKAGTKCAKLNSTAVSAGVKYTCIKSGTKLVWNKGVKVATPTPTETRRPQKITLSTAAITYQQGSLDVLLPISTEANLGYTLESQSRRICTIGRENRVNFFEVGKCIIKVSVNETSRYQANSVLFYIDVVAKPTPTATSEAILAGIRAAAIANNTFYLDRDYCHNRGVNAELQINEAGIWKRLVGATGWEESSSCPAEKPVKPWVAIDVPAGTTLRWRFWLSGVFDMNTATFMALTKKGQTPTATATPTPTPTVKPSATPTPTSNAAAADAAAKAAADAAAKAAADAAAKAAADAAAKAAADAAAKAAADAAAKAAADAAAKAAADAAAKAAADAAAAAAVKKIKYFTVTGTVASCSSPVYTSTPGTFISGRLLIPYDGVASKPSTDFRNGTLAKVYSGTFQRDFVFNGGRGVNGTVTIWTRTSFSANWTLFGSGYWAATVAVDCYVYE